MAQKWNQANSDFQSTNPVVFVVEDDEDYRNALCLVIKVSGFEAVGYHSATQFIECYDPEQPGCLVLDLQTPGFDAVELYSVLVKMGGAHPFIVMSAHGSVPKVAQAMRHGAVDFLAKPVNHEVLVQRIQEAISKDLSRRTKCAQREAVQSRLEHLSNRESEVLRFVADGLASKQIAKRLEIGANTVDVHRSNVMKKMNVSSSVELVRVLSDHALLPTAER